MRILSLKLRALRLVHHVHAAAVDVELPAVVDAAQPALLVAAEEERGAAVRAELVEQPDPALRVAEGHQVLAQQLHAHRAGSPAPAAPAPAAPGSSSGASWRPSGCRDRRGSVSSLSSRDSMLDPPGWPGRPPRMRSQRSWTAVYHRASRRAGCGVSRA